MDNSRNGNAVFNNIVARGHIEASSGSFSGELKAATGTFSGDISAANGTFSGTVYAEKIIGETVHAGVWDPIYVVGVNGSNHRYFNGGLPYTSIIVVPYVNIATTNTGGGSGQVYIKVNGVDYWRSQASPTGYNSPSTYRGSIVIEVPAYGTLDVEFGITGAASGQVWTNTINPSAGAVGIGGTMSVMAFRKGQNRFS